MWLLENFKIAYVVCIVFRLDSIILDPQPQSSLPDGRIWEGSKVVAHW